MFDAHTYIPITRNRIKQMLIPLIGKKMARRIAYSPYRNQPWIKMEISTPIRVLHPNKLKYVRLLELYSVRLTFQEEYLLHHNNGHYLLID